MRSVITSPKRVGKIEERVKILRENMDEDKEGGPGSGIKGHTTPKKPGEDKKKPKKLKKDWEKLPKKIGGWERSDPGNAEWSYDKGDWAVSLVAPTEHDPNAEVRIINWETNKRITVPGSPSILLKRTPEEILAKVPDYIDTYGDSKGD